MYCRSLVSWLGLTISDCTTAGTMPCSTMSTTIQTAMAAGHHWRRRQMLQIRAAASRKAMTMST